MSGAHLVGHDKVDGALLELPLPPGQRVPDVARLAGEGGLRHHDVGPGNLLVHRECTLHIRSTNKVNHEHAKILLALTV